MSRFLPSLPVFCPVISEICWVVLLLHPPSESVSNPVPATLILDAVVTGSSTVNVMMSRSYSVRPAMLLSSTVA